MHTVLWISLHRQIHHTPVPPNQANANPQCVRALPYLHTAECTLHLYSYTKACVTCCALDSSLIRHADCKAKKEAGSLLLCHRQMKKVQDSETVCFLLLPYFNSGFLPEAMSLSCCDVVFTLTPGSRGIENTNSNDGS